MTVELEMDGGPTYAPAKPRTTAQLIVDGAAKITGVSTLDQLEQVVAVLRAMPEDVKVRLRPLVKARQDLIKSRTVVDASAAEVVPTLPTPEPAPATPASPMIAPGGETFPAPVQASFADIATESSTNAAVASSGSLADGTMRGVGFSTPEGYIQALERGTTPATRASYLGILQERYGRIFEPAEAMMRFPVLARSALPVGPGIVHTPAGPSVFDLPRSQRQAIPTLRTVVADPKRRELTAGNLVAGASEEATGVFLSWTGLGELKIGYIEDCLTAAHVPTGWAPARKSRHFHAAEAIRPMNNDGLVVRAERGGARMLPSLTTGIQRRYAAAWTVMRPAHGEVGTKAGETVARFQLTTTGELESSCEADFDKWCARIGLDFERRVADEILPAGDVTKWLRAFLYEHCGAVRVGGNYYVRSQHAGMAERVCNALARGWGMDWMLPALPVATSAQLRAGLVRGFVREVNDLLEAVTKARNEAVKAKKADVSPAAAASFLLTLRETNDRAKTYREVLGTDSVAEVSVAITGAIAVLEPLCDSTAERFAALEAY